MRAVIQRVSKANLKINSELVSSINKGLVVLLGIGNDDTESDIKYLAEKISNLRIFEDGSQNMNLYL